MLMMKVNTVLTTLCRVILMIHCKNTKIWQLIITIYNTFTKYPNKAISILFPGYWIIYSVTKICALSLQLFQNAKFSASLMLLRLRYDDLVSIFLIHANPGLIKALKYAHKVYLSIINSLPIMVNACMSLPVIS